MSDVQDALARLTFVNEEWTPIVDAARRYANPDYEAGWLAWMRYNPWWLRWLFPRTPIKWIVDAALHITEDSE